MFSRPLRICTALAGALSALTLVCSACGGPEVTGRRTGGKASDTAGIEAALGSPIACFLADNTASAVDWLWITPASDGFDLNIFSGGNSVGQPNGGTRCAVVDDSLRCTGVHPLETVASVVHKRNAPMLTVPLRYAAQTRLPSKPCVEVGRQLADGTLYFTTLWNEAGGPAHTLQCYVHASLWFGSEGCTHSETP